MEITALLDRMSRLLWGRGTIFFVLGVGVVFTIGTGFLPILRARTVCQKTMGSLFHRKKGGISPFAAMSAALGGTMGVGNIIGVGAAMELGGPGAIFWMWIGALAGMMTKYAEVLLAVRYREGCGSCCRGGPMYYMAKGWSGRLPGKRVLTAVFCTACMIGSMGTGNMTQTNAISRTLHNSFGIPVWITAVGVTAVCAWVVMGGSNRIVRVASAVVPAMAVLYLAGAFFILFRFHDALPSAFGEILRDAFQLKSAAGGTAGLLCSRAVQVGISRGIFTNEAGLGSAPIAHACADTDSCVEQGMWGIFEVFADTIAVCTVTALVILVSGVPLGADATSAAFCLVMGDWGGKFLSVAVCFFAIASVFTWCMYGQNVVEFLFPNRPKMQVWFNRLFLTGCFCGCVADISAIWLGADILNACMMLPNLAALILLSPTVFRETRSYFQKAGAGGPP